MATSVVSKMLTATAGMATAASLAGCRTMTCSASRIAPQPPDLIRWVRREGGFVNPKLKISDSGAHGLCVVAAEDIPEGSDLISLPSHLPLRFKKSPESDGDSALMEIALRVPEELWAMKLGLRLLQERAAVGSFWWPYISNLPETFSLPIFFSGEDIKNIQYAPLIHQVNKRCRFLLEFEKAVKLILENLTLKDHPFGGQDVNSSSLGWAMASVSSRAFRLHGTHSDTPMLLPLIDMCNHSFHPNARIVQEQDASNPNMLVKAMAEHRIEQNALVMLNYGLLSNDLFLLDYGFVVPSNPYDLIELKYDNGLLDVASMAAGVSSPSFSSPAQWQQEILCQLNLFGSGADLKVTLGGAELVDGRLIAALRVLLANDEAEVQKYNLNTLMSLSEKAPLGVSVETSALRTVVALCVVALEHFPTKIMQDESVLKGAVSSSMELAVRFRMQKKLKIIDVMRKLTQRIRLLAEEKSVTQC
ncbi:hypothetical protein J5N97_005592 [Dioscorea zingiberensis]|uniref:SET domain-containing protein n=1 Tax=Dioscorea zingiberensis TaxID=325984 RepID=A0A9D5D8S0_9LILI|nr:hypothetical protein J5N97_005592 [Dioscorea zingiberensis]